MKPFTTIAAVLFAIIAVMHALRLALGWSVTVAGIAIPWWPSAVGLAVAAALAIGLWREARGRSGR